MGRRKRKEPSGDQLVMAIIFAIGGLLYLNRIPLSAVIFYSFLVIVIVLFIRFTLSQSKIDEPLNFKTSKPKSKTSLRPKKDNARSKALPVITRARPSEWSKELISELDWRVFEKLCLNIWHLKGFSVKETGAGADGGVDFYLYAKATKQKIGVVQCKSWSKRQIDVKVLRELQGVVASEQLKLGLLMYSGILSKGAHEFMKNPAVSVKAQGGADILAEIGKLSSETQAELLKKMTVGDYEKPSCPNCDTKLVRRTAHKTGKQFWGCANFPRCRYTMY
jgi:restriction system protein